MERPLCISTLDLVDFGVGGIVTKALIFAEVARKQGFAPFFLMPSVRLHRTAKRLLRRESPPAMRESEFHGYRCVQLGARFPELEQNAHRFDPRALRSVLKEPIPCVAVSGNNHAARPFLEMGMRYSIWPGSTYWEDCRWRVDQSPWSLRKALDLATKKACERLERRIFTGAIAIAVDTAYTAKCAVWLVPELRGGVEVIPVPVDCTRYGPRDCPSRKTIVFLGRLEDPRKNLPLLLEAFSLCASSDKQLRLLLVGTASAGMPERLRRRPFGDRIEWRSAVDEPEKIALLQQALALVIPSFQEGYGIVAAEAAACGVPVVSTPCGGTLDIVVDGETGILLKGFDPAEMSQALLRVAGDPALQQRMGRQAREHALARLSLKAIEPHLVSLIQRTLDSDKSSRSVTSKVVRSKTERTRRPLLGH